MHIADINGRAYARNKREAQQVWKFAACWCLFLLAVFALVMVRL